MRLKCQRECAARVIVMHIASSVTYMNDKGTDLAQGCHHEEMAPQSWLLRRKQGHLGQELGRRPCRYTAHARK